MMKLLITGGSGFIGTNVVSHFENKYEIANIDHTVPKRPEHNKYWHNVDITDHKATLEAVSGFDPDYIIHLAARTDLDGTSVEDYAANTIGVQNILKAASALTHLKKIIITSSMLVCHVGYMPKHQKDYSPTTFYGKSKVETERITWAANLTCDWAIIRPTSIWGPWFGVPYRNFFDIVKKRMYFHIGHKACTKTYGYVGNAVYQIEKLLLASTEDTNNKVFYIGDRPPINIEEWANQIASRLGITVPRLPWCIARCAALAGDLLHALRLPFPMSSFRLRNMTTDNIVPLDNTYDIAPAPPYTRMEGITHTLHWLGYLK